MNTELIPISESHLGIDCAAERYESYRYAAKPLCDATPLRDRAAADASCSGWLVDDVMMGRSSFTWTRFERSARQARSGGGYLMEICQGEQFGDVDGHPVRIDGEAIVLRDLSRPFKTVGYADEMIGFFIPRYRIEASDWLGRYAPVVQFPLSTPGGQILWQTVRSIMDLLPTVTRGGASVVTDGFVGLLNGLLKAEQHSVEGQITQSHVDAACLDSMKAFLVNHLGDPDLSVSTLMGQFHCSRAGVYRLFADEGGVAAFIRQQRLTRCYDALSRASKRPGLVQEVAERYGYYDPHYFSRLFKRNFSVAPSSVIGLGTPWSGDVAGESRCQGAQIHNWVQGAIETFGLSA